MPRFSKETNDAFAQIKADVYHCLDTTDKETLGSLQRRIRSLQQMADSVELQIEADIKKQAEQINA